MRAAFFEDDGCGEDEDDAHLLGVDDAMIDAFLGRNPAALTAMWCALFACLWQFLGASFLARLLTFASRPRLTWHEALMLAWVMWLPFSGAAALLLIMLGWGEPETLRKVAWVFLVTAGLLSGPSLRQIGQSLGRLFRTNGERVGLVATCCGLIVAVVKLSEFAYAAHPQRQYDQLNYHLVVAKAWVANGRLPRDDFDPHLLMAGPLEYAWMWVRALVPSDLFQIGFAQVAVFVAVVPAFLMAWDKAARSLAPTWRRWNLAAALSLVPAALPDAEFLRLAKPNGLLFAGAAILLCAAVCRRRQFLAWTGGVCLTMIAANQTFWHAALALGVMVLVLVLVLPAWRRHLSLPALFAQAPMVMGVGIFCFGVAVIKSFHWAGSPFYPTDAAFFGSPEANATTMAYWQRTAAAGESSFWTRPLGGVVATLRSPGLSAWLTLCAVSVGWAWHEKTLSTVRWRRFFAPIGLFIAAYVCLWPLFYGANIASRFVAAWYAALLFASLGALLVVSERLRHWLTLAAVVIGTVCSGVDVMVRKMKDWNAKDLNGAFEMQLPRFATAKVLNRWMDASASLLADDPIKYFFDARVLHETLSPREQKAWSELLAQPQKAAADYGIKALCVRLSHLEGREGDEGMGGPVVAVWHKLAPFGRRMELGDDIVLYSNCAFRQKPCPRADPLWSQDGVTSALGDEAAAGTYHP